MLKISRFSNADVSAERLWDLGKDSVITAKYKEERRVIEKVENQKD